MATYYIIRVFEILQKEGIYELINEILRKIDKWFKIKRNIRYVYYYVLYRGSTPKPNKIIKVNPNNIKHAISHPHTYKPLSEELIKIKNNPYKHVPKYVLDNHRKYTILGGSWDTYKIPMKNVYYVKGIVERFDEGKDWRNTSKSEWYEMLQREKEMFENDNDEVEQLYASIQKNGFDSDYPIKVCIGRDGDLIRANGFHRVTISKLFNLDEIPAKVTIRHKNWQKLRCKIYKNGLQEGQEDLLDHPDLQDILD